MLCNEVNTTFSGRSLCSISNSAVLCTALLKAACCQPEQSPVDVSRSPSQRPQRPGLSPGVGGGLFASPRSNGSTARTHSRKSSSGGGGGVGVDGVDGVGSRNVLGRSKPIPIKRQRSKRDRESMTSQGFFPNSTCGVGSASYTSPAFFPQSWSIISSNGRDRLGSGGKVSRHQTPRSYRSWVILNDSELESGYEADVERGTPVCVYILCHHLSFPCAAYVQHRNQCLCSGWVCPEIFPRVWVHYEDLSHLFHELILSLWRGHILYIHVRSMHIIIVIMFFCILHVHISCVTYPSMQEHAPVLLYNVAVTTTQTVLLSSFIEFSYPRPVQV